MQLIETPAFHAETFPAWGANAGPRAIWVAAFLAEGRRYAVVINAETGTLAYLTCQSDRRPKPAFVRMAPIETPHQAAEAALHRLRDLRLVRPGTKVWLKQSPQQITRRQEWKVVWLARSPWAPQPYEVRLVLSCIGGFPLEAVNRGEMRPGAGP